MTGAGSTRDDRRTRCERAEAVLLRKALTIFVFLSLSFSKSLAAIFDLFTMDGMAMGMREERLFTLAKVHKNSPVKSDC